MHLMDVLPAEHAVGWWAASAPFLAYGVYSVGRTMKKNPEVKLLIGAAGGFAFVLSALKIPLPSGTSAHPTGVGLGAMLFGPSVMTVLGTIILLFQAMFLAHGGMSTLGANAFSMAIVGSWVAFLTFRLARGVRVPFSIAVFLGAALADLATYCVTAIQLAWGRQEELGGFVEGLIKVSTIFGIPQIPLAISEGLLTVLVMNLLMTYNRSQLGELVVLPKEKTR